MKKPTLSAEKNRRRKEFHRLLERCGLANGAGLVGTWAAHVIQAAIALATDLLAIIEKIAQHVVRIGRKYQLDALAQCTVSQVMTARAETVPLSLPLKHLFGLFYGHPARAKHQGYPVVDEAGQLVGMVTRSDLPEFSLRIDLGWLVVADVMSTRTPIVAFPDEPVRDAAKRMVLAGIGRLPVVLPESPDRVVGILSRSDVLRALAHRAEEEHRRQRLPDSGRRREAA